MSKRWKERHARAKYLEQQAVHNEAADKRIAKAKAEAAVEDAEQAKRAKQEKETRQFRKGSIAACHANPDDYGRRFAHNRAIPHFEPGIHNAAFVLNATNDEDLFDTGDDYVESLNFDAADQFFGLDHVDTDEDEREGLPGEEYPRVDYCEYIDLNRLPDYYAEGFFKTVAWMAAKVTRPAKIRPIIGKRLKSNRVVDIRVAAKETKGSIIRSHFRGKYSAPAALIKANLAPRLAA